MPKDADTADEELAVPRIGVLTMLAIAITFVLQAVFGYWVYLHNASSFGQAAWIGLMWFGLLMASHLCFTPPIRWRWIGLGLATFIWHILVMSICWRMPILRYVLMFGVATAVQIAMITIMGLPAWEGFAGTLVNRTQRHRFTIRSIILCTTVVAVLLATSRQYSLAMIDIQLAAIPLFVLLWLLAASTMLAWRYRIWRAAFLAVVLVGGSLMFTWVVFAWKDSADQGERLGGFVGALRDAQPPEHWFEMHFYTFAIFAIAASILFGFGRLDARDFRMRQQRDGESSLSATENFTKES